MKICVILPRGMTFSPNGATSIDLVAHDLMLKSRHRGTSFMIGQATPEPFCDVDFRPVPSGKPLTMIQHMVSALRADKPDIIVVHQHPESAARIAKSLPDLPVVLHRHGLLRHKHGFLSRWNKGRHFKPLAGIVFVSDYIKDDFFNAYPRLSLTSQVVFNGVDPDIWSPAAQKDKIIIFVGRARADKGLIELLQAFQAIAPSGWQLTLILGVQTAGEKIFYEHLTSLAHGVAHMKILCNLPSSAVRDHLSRAAIAALPSLVHEGFPRAVVEAMACGCATIATNRGGTPQATGKSALLLDLKKDQDLVDELSHALHQLITRESERTKLGAAGRQTILDHLSLDGMAHRYDDFLERFLQTDCHPDE